MPHAKKGTPPRPGSATGSTWVCAALLLGWFTGCARAHQPGSDVSSGDAGTDAGTDVGCAPDDSDPPAVVFGACEDGEWSELACGGRVQLMEGYEGECCHFHACIRERGLSIGPPAERGVRLDYEMVDDEGVVWGRSEGEIVDPPDRGSGWQQGQDGWYELREKWMEVLPDRIDALGGRLLTVTVRFTEADGDSFEDTHRVQPFYPGAADD